jgi:hypothetical protein
LLHIQLYVLCGFGRVFLGFHGRLIIIREVPVDEVGQKAVIFVAKHARRRS